MKVDELLKHLENIKTDEDEINERREIAEYIAQILGAIDPVYMHYFMTKDRKIYDISLYEKLLKYNKISPGNAYVYVENHYFTGYDSTKYFYPFLKYGFLYAYLSKLGFSSVYAVPASGLKYVSIVVHYPDAKRAVVEVANIDNVAIYTNLPRIVRDISTKQIDDDELKEIVSQLDSQKLFAGYDFNEARHIINRYYEDHDASLADDVESIREAYNRIFRPYRVVYDLETKQFQVSGSNEGR